VHPPLSFAPKAPLLVRGSEPAARIKAKGVSALGLDVSTRVRSFQRWLTDWTVAAGRIAPVAHDH
jgi:hypothetical protein